MPAPPAENKPRKKTNYLLVHNVRPGILAWQLDPANDEIPREFLKAKIVEDGILSPSTATSLLENTGRRLPPGVDRIVAIDPQKALLVFGTEDGVARLRDILDRLDKPMSPVEVEARYVLLDPAEIQKLNLGAQALPKDLVPFAVTHANANDLTRLNDLIAARKAETLMAPRCTMLTGVARDLRSFTEAPAVFGYSKNGQFQETAPTSGPKLINRIGIGFTARVNVNADKTLSLEIAPGRVLQIAAEGTQMERPPVTNFVNFDSPATPFSLNAPYLWQKNLDGVQTIPSLKDGETVILSGGDARMVTGPGQPAPRFSGLLILVTAKRVNAVGDDVGLANG